ncbi:MAG: hypothetical protein J0H74_20405 [Chitinophagaceae bacterium]|nr:hypothetical protein [Chitinophagaceae bacterium]
MRNASFGSLIIAALLGCYLVNCFSPLRLEYDSIRYFALKDCLEQSCPPGFQAANDPHPYGYPFLLLLLSRTGLLHPFTIAFVNLLYLAGALYFTGKLFQKEKSTVANARLELGVILLLLSYPVIKFSPYPMSEMQYLFFSCGSLFFFHLYTDRGERPGALILAVLFAGLAILTRTVGIVLLPALTAGLAWHHRTWVMRNWKIVVLTVVVAGIVLVMAGGTGSGLYMNSVRHTGYGWKVLLREHLAEWGQLLLNVPVGKIAGTGVREMRWLAAAVGLLFVCVVSYQLIRQRKKVPAAAGVYLVLYCMLIFYWPFFDVRFWIPVAPLMVMILLYGSYPRFFRLVVIVYVLAGAGANGYSFYTTFNKHALARSQAGGQYRNEYETFFFGKPSGDTSVQVDPYVLHVLETCR